MKNLTIFVFSALILLHTGCERHPASVTVPGYAEKQAAKEEKAAAGKKTEPVNADAPTFFPSPTPAGH